MCGRTVIIMALSLTEFETILTSVELEKVKTEAKEEPKKEEDKSKKRRGAPKADKRRYRLPKAELERVERLLKRSVDKEAGRTGGEDAMELSEDNPDGRES